MSTVKQQTNLLQKEKDFLEILEDEVSHLKIYDSEGKRDYDTEIVHNSYWGELPLTSEDFTND